MQRSFKHRVKAVQDGLPKPRQLFLSYSIGKPLRRASISQYLLEVLSLAGINTSTFKAHSTRGALPSIMSARGASPHVILNHGDWRNLGTFKKFYDRHSDSSIEGRLIRQATRNSGRVPTGKTGKSGKTGNFKIFCQVKSAHCTHRDILANFFFPERGDQSASFPPPPPPPSPKDKSPKKWVNFWAKKFDAELHKINSFSLSKKSF